MEQIKAFYRPKGEAVLQGEELATSPASGAWLYFPSLGWRKDAIVGTGFREGLNVIQDMALPSTLRCVVVPCTQRSAWLRSRTVVTVVLIVLAYPGGYPP